MTAHAPSVEEPFPQEWSARLCENVFLYHLLSEAEQARLRRAVQRFIAGKFWEGCAGLRITEEMQVTIAGQACLLVIGFDNYCFEDHKTILVYPGGYLGIGAEESGETPDYRLGEAHHDGPVVLSWWHARWGGQYWCRPNIVIHEFAHKLAEKGDPHIGLPRFDDSPRGQRSQAAIRDEYRQLCEDASYLRPALLDLYGATNPAEFFAVASECFFLRPHALIQRHPTLYQILAECYRQEPTAWRVDVEADALEEEAKEKQLRHTLIECDALIKRFPKRSDGYRKRAATWLALGEFDNAGADYSRLIDLAGKREKPDAYCERGWFHCQTHGFSQAIDDFNEAICRWRDFADAYCGRGVAYASLGQFERAIADLTRALRLDPNDDAALQWRAYIRRETGKYDKALRDLSNVIRLCPHSAGGYRERGIVYLRKKDYKRAIADLNTAIRLDGEDVDSYAARADAFAAQGQAGEAECDRAKAEQMCRLPNGKPSQHRETFPTLPG